MVLTFKMFLKNLPMIPEKEEWNSRRHMINICLVEATPCRTAKPQQATETDRVTFAV